MHERSLATAEITRVGGRYAVQGYSRSPISLLIEKYMRLISVSNANLHHISHRSQVIADYWSNLRF